MVEELKIANCPKNLKRCAKDMCTMFSNCFAYEEHMARQAVEKRQSDDGWE